MDKALQIGDRVRLRLNTGNVWNLRQLLEKRGLACEAALLEGPKLVGYNLRDHFKVLAAAADDALHACDAIDLLQVSNVLCAARSMHRGAQRMAHG